MKNELIPNVNKIKIKLFSHTDLDGISCHIALKKLFDKDKVSINSTFIDYSSVDKIRDFIEDYDQIRMFDFVIISDINITWESYCSCLKVPLEHFIQNKNNFQNANKLNLFKKLFIIDHHVDSEKVFRDKVNQIFDVIEYYNDTTNCASYQLFDWCVNKRSRCFYEVMEGTEHKEYSKNVVWCKDYLKHVNDWDLFLWKENHNIVARDLNLLFNNTRREKFILMQEQKQNLFFIFNKSEKIQIKETLETIEKEYNKAFFNKVFKDIFNEKGEKLYTSVIIKSDEHISLITDLFKEYLIKNKIKVDIIVNVSFKHGAISFRRLHDKIDCAKIANFYGGGGHPFASGCPIDSNNRYIMEDIIYPILSTYKKK